MHSCTHFQLTYAYPLSQVRNTTQSRLRFLHTLATELQLNVIDCSSVMRFFSSPKSPDGTRAHSASYLWVLGLFPYRNATGAWDRSLISIHGRCYERVEQYYIPPVCLHVTHGVINLFTELFVEDRNLFYLYADVDLTEAISLTLIRWTKLQCLRHG